VLTELIGGFWGGVGGGVLVGWGGGFLNLPERVEKIFPEP